MNAENVKNIARYLAPLVVAAVAYLLQVDPLDLCRPAPPAPAAEAQ